MSTILTAEQLELGAKFFAASNTGLIGCGHNHPTSKDQIKNVYRNISGDYAAELGEGLGSELQMWKENLNKITSKEDSLYQTLVKEVPFIFEEGLS